MATVIYDDSPGAAEARAAIKQQDAKKIINRQTNAIKGMDSAISKADGVIANPSSSNQNLYNAKNDVRIASQEGRNAKYEAEVFQRSNVTEYDSQITTNNSLIQQRREESYQRISAIDNKLGPDYTPVVDQAGVGGETAVTGTNDSVAPDFTPVRGETQGATSAGSIVDNDALAGADKAGTQTPYPSHLKSNSGTTVTQSNADQIPTSPYGTTEAAQVTPSLLQGGSVSADDSASVVDDSQFIQSTKGGVATAKAFSQNFEARPNPTSEFAQLTYNIALYLQTPEQYKKMLVEQTKSTQGLKKILQSGGNSQNEEVIFPDLYIDNLEIETLMEGQNEAPHNVVQMRFEILEPMGYTFLKKLRQLCHSNGMTEIAKQHYLMVIKYKGFDENGKQLSEEDDIRLTKFVPFTFSKILTRVKEGAVTYDCQAICPNHHIGLSAKRGVIPFNVELVGQTLSDMFNANSNITNTPAQSTSQKTATSPFGTTETTVTPGILKGNATGTPQQSKGIIDALNEQQKKLAKKAGYKYPDKYKVTFNGDIGKAKCISSDTLLKVKNKTPMSASAKQAASALLNSTTMDKTRQIYSVNPMPLHQFLDIMIRSSDYITKQQTHLIDPKTGEVKPNPAQNKFLQWYSIGVRLLPIEWDDKRADYAYEIEYIISPRQIVDTYSPFFPKAPLRGVHKKYNYWFTGENTEILNYEQELNATYFVAMDGRIEQPDQVITPESQKSTSKAFVNQSGTSGVGQPGDNASAAMQAADVIYSSVDFQKFNMEIIGDPDYIQQNDILYTSGNTYEPFLADGSINYDASEIFVQVGFRTMEDYKEDGSADLKDPTFIDGSGQTSSDLIYKLVKVSSRFSGGTMTQTMEGLLREFDPEETDTVRETNTAPTAKRKPSTVSAAGNQVPGSRAITDNNTQAPDFTPVSVAGNKVPGEAAISQNSDIAPDFTPISVAQNSQGVYDTAGPIGPNFAPIDNGNSVPGQRAITPDNPTAPDFLPIRGETQGN